MCPAIARLASRPMLSRARPTTVETAAGSHARRAQWWSSQTYPRVQPGDDDVDQNVEQDEYDSVQEHEVLHHEHVALAHGSEHGVAEPWRAERPLHGDRPG